MTVGHGDTRRLLADGAGLCSPGLWPPERRHPPTGLAAKLHDALAFEVKKLGQSHSGGLDGILADLAAGRVHTDPFPPEATERLRAYAKDLTRGVTLPLPEGRPIQPQPVDTVLLGKVLRAFGGPDWEVFGLFSVGVHLGLGVDMPRTPAVFPAKTKWSIK